MANFRTHLTVAATVSSALAIGGSLLNLYGATTAVLCAVIGTLGGLLPDIDLDHSKPARQGFLIAALITSALITIIYANRYTQDALLLDSLILWGVSFAIVRFGLLETFSRLTVHRGIVHSLPFMALFALAVCCGAFYGLKMTAFVSWLLAIFLFIGSVVHLLLDEIYSIDAFGLRVKRSFGSAMKVFEINKPLSYIMLYALVVAISFATPPFSDTLRAIRRIANF